MRFVLATRGSPLALWQAEETRRLLALARPEADVRLEIVQSGGDRDDRADLASLGTTGVFTVEIDRAVLDGRADAGVHSLKDMTTSLPEGLVLRGTLARGPVEDVLVSRGNVPLEELPAGAAVGTGSVRRMAMIRRARPDLRTVPIRGNVDTRLRKLEEGSVAAIVLARAGLERLGLAGRVTQVLGPPRFLPAVGQAIVGLTCRSDDEIAGRVLQAITDRESWAEALAERALLHELHGGCNAPIGARARAAENALAIRAVVLSRDGAESLEGERSGPVADAESIGRALAAELASRGAERLVRAARTG